MARKTQSAPPIPSLDMPESEDLIAAAKAASDFPEDQKIWLTQFESLIPLAKAGKDPVSLFLQLDKIMGQLQTERLEMLFQNQRATFANPSTSPAINVYQLKIELANSRPSIWRRVLVPGYVTLAVLHHVIQFTMGWEDDHLHSFSCKGRRFSTPFDGADDFFSEDKDEDESQVRLNELLSRPRSSMRYEYDFGDCWEHKITLEKIFEADPRCQERAICLDGRMSGPPEDCGGLWGYYDLLDALKDSTHERHEELVEWAGPYLDAEAFDLESVNRRLAGMRIPTPRKRSRKAPAR